MAAGRYPTAWILAASALLALAQAASSAHAQSDTWTLHVLGPPGSSVERRVVVVVEGPRGCAPPGDVTFAVVEAGVSVERVETAAGGCAQWVSVRGPPGLAAATLEAVYGDARARAQVSFDARPRLDVQVQRRAGVVRVTVTGGEPRSVTAYTADGSTALARAGAAWEGPATDASLLVVASGDDVFGAAILPDSRARSGSPPLVLLAPAREQVVAGGAPRGAAVVATFDANGRPTRAMSLSVTSERGQLRSMEWMATGLAEIRLGAPIGVASVDLSVSAPHAQMRQLEVVARPTALPMRSELRVELPASRRSAGTRLFARAWDDGGRDVEPGRLRLRCGDGTVRELDSAGTATCPASSTASTATVLAAATDDSVPYPLASTEVAPLAASAVAVVVARGPDEPPPAAAGPGSRAHPWTVGGRVTGGVDTWGRPAIGAGARIGFALGDRVRVEGGVGYAVVGVSADAASLAATNLEGVAHTIEVPLGVAVALVRGPYGIGARASLAPAWVKDAGHVGTLSADASAWRLAASLTVGPRLTTHGFELGVDVGVRVCGALTDGAWAEPPVRVIAEVSGALAL